MSKINYPKSKIDNELLRQLRKRVKDRVDGIPRDRSIYVKIKVILLSLVYFGSYLMAITHGDNPLLYIVLFVLMGLTLVLMYLNIFHEAAHENIYKNKTLNNLALNLFDVVGASSFIWKRRHVMSHHNYANVDGWDTDVEQSGPIKIFPHVEAKGIQKHQHKYIFFAYPFYLINWMLLRDFKDGFSKKRVFYKIHGGISIAEKVKLVFWKLFYLFYQIAIPIMFFGVSFKLAFGAWILQIFVASIFALFVLLPLHALPDNAFPLPDGEGNLPYSWLKHQLAVTNDLSHNNWFIRHVLGNFNYHVAHHIFPHYSYAYYPEITEEIEMFSAEHGLPYKTFPLLTALSKHYDLLKMNAENRRPLQFVFEQLDS